MGHQISRQNLNELNENTASPRLTRHGEQKTGFLICKDWTIIDHKTGRVIKTGAPEEREGYSRSQRDIN